MNNNTIDILLVEDEDAHIELVIRCFRNESDFHFTIAKSLAEAKNILAKQQPDILITDWRLPDGDAIELIPKDRNILAYPIIIMTSYGNEELAVDAIKAGAMDFVVKSIEAFSKLPFIIRRSLREWDHIIKIKNAENALRISEEKYRLLIEHAVDAIFLIEMQGKLFSVNSKACELSGYTKEELMMMQIHELFTVEELQRMPLQYERLQKGENVINLRQLRRKDGTLLPVEINSKFMQEGYIQCFFRDISERIRTEELKRKFEETEYLVKVKSQFLANLSHEIRNPLNAIIGLTNILSKTQLSDIQKKYITSIKFSSENLLGILNDILDLSKIEANKVDVCPESFHFRSFINEIVSIYESRVTEQGLKITYSISNDVPAYVNTDLKKLKQILSNLISNAIKFTSEGEITIRSEIIKSSSGRQCLQICISDTGIGIKKEDFPKIFQSFTQLDSSTKKSYSGTGLGLSISKNYIELLKGKIFFDSEYGKGSKFYIQIPYTKVDELPVKEEITEDKIFPLPASIKVLVAEDDAINRMYISNFLLAQGWTVDTAKNGIEVLEKWEQNSYHILLLDGQMPKMDGFEAAETIRAKELLGKTKIPIIAITGYTINEKNEQFVKAQIDDYIIKPINENDLLNKIARLVSENNQ